jgi:hypothetical protein
MHTVRDYIASTGFQFRRKWATVQPGAREGLMGWVAVQHERQYEAWYHGGPIEQVDAALFNRSIGMMDLGGASTQITFATTPDDAHKSVVSAKLGGADFSIYSKSYLGFGVREALKRFLSLFEQSMDTEWHAEHSHDGDVDDDRDSSESEPLRVHGFPCFLVGHHKHLRTNTMGRVKLVGTGEYDKCLALVKQEFLHEDGSPVVNKLHLRKIHFVAIQDFAELARTFTGHANHVMKMDDFGQAVREYCSKPKKEHDKKKHRHKKWLCFRGTYLYALFRSLGFHHESTIEFALRVRDTELSWPIGEIIYEKDRYKSFRHQPPRYLPARP